MRCPTAFIETDIYANKGAVTNLGIKLAKEEDICTGESQQVLE